MNVSKPEKVIVETLSVIADPQGNATAVWRLFGREDGVVKSAERGAGGSWSAPHKLFEDGDRWGPQIAVDPLGNTTAVWTRFEGRSFVVQSASRPAGGSWSAPVNLSKSGAFEPLVAVDPEGEVTAIWLLERAGGNRSVVQSASRPAGGSWSAPVNLSSVKQAARSPQVALDPLGGATAVWEVENSGAVQSASRPAGGSWSAPVNLSGIGAWTYQPQVAVDSQGNATAVWTNSEGKGSLIESATRPAGGSWSAPVNLSKPARNTQEAQIAVGPQGDATAIWARSNGGDLVIQGATRRAGGSWSAPVDITAHHGQGGFFPRLVVDSRGNATAAWKGYDRNRHSSAIQAATRPIGSGWSPPTDVSKRVGRDMSISEPQIAVDLQGISTVVWVIGARGGGIVQAATSVSMTQPREASAKPGFTVYPASQYRMFHSPGTHGTDISVSASADGWVEIGAFQLRRPEMAEYFARGSVGPRRVKARFGSIGQIDMDWTPTSKWEVTPEPQGDCRGRKALIQQGRWVGRFSFRGENGYAEVDVKRISGIAVHAFREVCKGPDAGGEYSTPPEETLLAHSRRGRREVDFQTATRAARGGRIEEFHASLTERRPKLFVRRSTFAGGEAVVGQFDFDGTTGSARVAPPEPFLGSAELDPAAAETWTGDLMVPFLGVGPVALTGPDFRASLHRSGGAIGPFRE